MLRRATLLSIAIILCTAAFASAQVGGSLSGIVKDPTRRRDAGRERDRHQHHPRHEFTTTTDGQGVYSFPNVPVGRYDLTLQLDGFKPQKRTGIPSTSTAPADRRHARGGRAERDRHGHGQRRARRNDLDADRRGRAGDDDDDAVAQRPQLHRPAGHSAGRDSGHDDAGRLDHHGRRHRARWRRRASSIPATCRSAASARSANSFLVNGSDVQERMNGGTVDRAQPRLGRSVPRPHQQLRSASTATTTAASSASSPSRAATCSTAARFEFVRNTALDARNYFSPERAEFKQQQPGGTVGGPLKKGKVFFFADYQGTRTTQGIETGLIPVPSLAERAGNFSATSPISSPAR